jgi:hypothetical protein
MADDVVGVRPAGLGNAGAVGGALARCLRRAVAWFGIGRAGRRSAVSGRDSESCDSAGGLPWWAETSMSTLSANTPIPPARKPARRPARRLRPH